MIKVLQVLPSLNRGGLETFVMNVYRNIDRTKIQFEFLTNTPYGDYENEILSLGGNIHYIPKRSNGLVQYWKNLNSFFNRRKGYYSAIHYHESSLTSLEVLYFARKYNIPKRIIHSHSSSLMGNKLHYLTHYLGKFAIRYLATDYFGCSDKALDWMFSNSGIRDKAILINNGIDVRKFAFNPSCREKLRSQLKLSDECCVIGHIGRFSKVKNHEFLIQILRELLKRKEDSKLLLVGDGNLKSEIVTQVKELGLLKKVEFLGIREDTNNLLQVMDVFVMPSFYEGLPVVLVEAQTSGLPVICSDTISNMSKLTDNYFSLSLKESAEVWADKIIKIYESFNRKDESSVISKQNFDISGIASYLSDVYSNLQ